MQVEKELSIHPASEKHTSLRKSLQSTRPQLHHGMGGAQGRQLRKSITKSSSLVRRGRGLGPDLDHNLDPKGTSFPTGETTVPRASNASTWEGGWCSVGVFQHRATAPGGRGLAPKGPGGPYWPLPSFSSWQMKEPKQSSPALSNAPGTLRPDPPTAIPGGGGERNRAFGTRGSRACFFSPGARGAADPLPEARRAVRPGRGRVWRGEGGCPASVAKDIPLREPPPPLPLPPAVPGPRQRKTKTRAEETAAGAPPEKPGQKARASRPRCPAAGGLTPPPWSVPSAQAAPYASRPPACLPPSRPPCPGHLSLRPPPRPATSPSSLQPCPRCPRRAPQAVPAERGRRDPGPAASYPAAPGSAPLPWPSALT